MVPLHEVRIVEMQEETMIVEILLALLADVVFGSTASLRRSFGTEMDRYLARRGFAPPSKRSATR
jgi:hypothetical protein